MRQTAELIDFLDNSFSKGSGLPPPPRSAGWIRHWYHISFGKLYAIYAMWCVRGTWGSKGFIMFSRRPQRYKWISACVMRPNVGWTLSHRLRRWPSVQPALGQCLAFSAVYFLESGLSDGGFHGYLYLDSVVCGVGPCGSVTMATIPCKAIRKYLFTLQVSRYCLLTLPSRHVDKLGLPPVVTLWRLQVVIDSRLTGGWHPCLPAGVYLC